MLAAWDGGAHQTNTRRQPRKRQLKTPRGGVLSAENLRRRRPGTLEVFVDTPLHLSDGNKWHHKCFILKKKETNERENCWVSASASTEKILTMYKQGKRGEIKRNQLN